MTGSHDDVNQYTCSVHSLESAAWFADYKYIANGLFSKSFGLPEMCSRAPVHLDIFHVIILCKTDLLFNKLYLQICYTDLIDILYNNIL